MTRIFRLPACTLAITVAVALPACRGESPAGKATASAESDETGGSAKGDFGPNSFYFRGPEGKLNLRAQNLQVFAELGDGVDETTWLYHLRRGDIAKWMADCVKDAELSAEIAAIADDGTLSAPEGRARVMAAITARYTAPA